MALRRRKKRNRQLINGWHFFLPGLLALFAIVGVPLLASFVYSLHEVRLYRFHTQPFVGLENYQQLLNDPLFWISTRVTLIYTAGVTFFSVLVGLVVALVLNRRDIRMRSLFIAFFLLPFVMTPVVVGIVWRLLMWEPEYGLVNYLLELVGLQGQPWLIDRGTALPATIATNVWRLAPLAMLVLYAALTTIPDEYVEAATVDGAGYLSILWHVIFPMLRGHVLFISLIILTSAFREFDTIFSLTGGGPGRATSVLSMLVYNRGINNSDMGYANAVAFSMFVIVAVTSWLYIKVFRLRHGRDRS